MPSKKEKAHARILELEAKPEHKREADPALADAETRNDDLDDPAHNDLTGEMDKRWTQDPVTGDWIDPDEEGEG